MNSFSRVSPPTPAAQQIDIGTHLGERVARRFDSGHPRDRGEDDLSTLRGQFVHTLGKGDGPEIHELRDVTDLLAESFHLTDHEREELLPSGQ
jgi:hypothetical protein